MTFPTLDSLYLVHLHKQYPSNWKEIVSNLNKKKSTHYSLEDCKQEYQRLSKGLHTSDKNSNIDEQIILDLNSIRIQEIRKIILSEAEQYKTICADIIRIRSGDMDSVLINDTMNESPLANQDSLKSNISPTSTTSSELLKPFTYISSQVSGFANGIIQKFSGNGANKANHSDKRTLDEEEEDQESDVAISKKKSKTDDKVKKFKSTALMMWNKVCDHRYGYVFLKKIKEPEFHECVKDPVCLESIKNRIREGTIKNTSEFHRDMTLMLTNIIMFHDIQSEIVPMAKEIKEFIDTEIQNWIVNE